MKTIFSKLMKRSARLRKAGLRGVAIPALIAVAVTAMALGSRPALPIIHHSSFSIPEDTVPVRRYLPGEIRDTTEYAAMKQAQVQRMKSTQYSIKLLTRSYGDSVVLRWLAPDYVGWRYMNQVGVMIVRSEVGGMKRDTIVQCLKPTPLEQALGHYAQTDSIARMGIGLVYNQKQANPYFQKDPAGEVGSIYGVFEDQQMQFGMSGLVAEWRADVATDMALRFVDRNVKKGKMYHYVVRPTVADTTGRVTLVPASAEVENIAYKPEPFDVALVDSVTAPTTVMLAWPATKHSSFEIERRTVSGEGSREWQRVNPRTYVVMLETDASDSCLYMDKAPGIGTYEYRIKAHDAFGDITEPSKPHTVVMPDLVPPSAPLVTRIILNRKGNVNSPQEITADIHWRKDEIEDDLVGYMPFYRHPRITKGEWWQLSKERVQPRDTTCVVDVSSLSTGDICIGAYDKAGNVSYSINQTIRIDDINPPHTPTGLAAETSAEKGLIRLTWAPVTDLDLKYYEVSFANDSTHAFMMREGGQVTDTCFIDTVYMEANQKYIYYKVRAVDETGNESQPSQMLQVIRPSNVPPVVAHIDSARTDEKGVYMRWVCSNEKQVARHHVLRRLENEKEWTLIRVCNGDSVKAAGDYIEFTDVPPVNAQKEWCYAIETFNYSEYSSGLSLQYQTLYRGQQYFDCQLKLLGSYEAKDGETHLAWEMGKQPPYEGDWYYCLYRKGPKDSEPKFFMTVDKTELDHVDYVLRPGEEAQYYMYVSFADGRRSAPSNTVTIKAPAKK